MKPKHEIPWRRHKALRDANRAKRVPRDEFALVMEQHRRQTGVEKSSDGLGAGRFIDSPLLRMIQQESNKKHGRLHDFLERLRGKQ